MALVPYHTPYSSRVDPAHIKRETKKHDTASDVLYMGEQFARLLRCSGDIFSTVFTEKVLQRNTELERQNKLLWEAVWGEYSQDALRDAILTCNRVGTGYRCKCHYCSKSAVPKLLPSRDPMCRHRLFMKMAINRAGLSFSANTGLLLSPDTVENYPWETSSINTHFVFKDMGDVYSIVYGARIFSDLHRSDSFVLGKLKTLFKSVSERTLRTFEV